MAFVADSLTTDTCQKQVAATSPRPSFPELAEIRLYEAAATDPTRFERRAKCTDIERALRSSERMFWMLYEESEKKKKKFFHLCRTKAKQRSLDRGCLVRGSEKRRGFENVN